MFKFFKTFFSSTIKDSTTMYNIKQAGNKFVIVNRNGVLAEGTGGFTRRRDAVRGATRRGLTLA